MSEPRLEDIRIIVEEKHGIRRFLYPLGEIVDCEELEDVLLVDSDGKIIPAEFDLLKHEYVVNFALSIAPVESKTLHFEQANGRISEIPDPLSVSENGDRLCVSQARVAYGFDKDGTLDSVVYDGVEHLAAKPQIQVSNFIEQEKYAWRKHHIDNGLSVSVINARNRTHTHLTSCKSWAKIGYVDSQKHEPRMFAKFSMPLCATSPVQTCDFGFGNGAYARLETGVIDKIFVNIDLTDLNRIEYQICSVLTKSAEPRIDYAGLCESFEEAQTKLWFHWIEPTKAVAVAIEELWESVEKIDIEITSAGNIDIAFHQRFYPDRAGQEYARAFAVTYHFLNAIPPIAAATNPTSIICKPEVRVEYANEG